MPEIDFRQSDHHQADKGALARDPAYSMTGAPVTARRRDQDPGEGR